MNFTATNTVEDETLAFLPSLPAYEARSVLAGRYELGALLGLGSTGQVYRAYDRVTRMFVALKMVRPDVAGRRSWLHKFGNEVRVSRELNHPNICRVFELVESDGCTFFTMEFAPGGTLRQLLVRGTNSSFESRLADARAVTSGLMAMHDAGLVHQDLKPENILRMADGQLVLADFGLATTNSARDGSGGTPNYMAPELSRGQSASFQSDVWSLGKVLAEILFGKADTPTGQAEEQWLLSARRLCDRCMDDDPSRRPPDATAVLYQLHWIDGDGQFDRLESDMVQVIRGRNGRTTNGGPLSTEQLIRVRQLIATVLSSVRGEAESACGKFA
jgi:serine/threonine protein kinase